MPEQLFALVLPQLMVLVPPEAMKPGVEVTVVVTAGPTLTMKELFAIAPPGARHWTEYVILPSATGVIGMLPPTLLPVAKLVPAQLVALELDQVS